jgi:uncharacterized membrane protein YfcA
VNLLAGSLAGAWLGADVATRLSRIALYRIIAILLLLIAMILVFAHDPATPSSPLASGATLIVLGLVAGLAIGGVASLLGVAGGEFLIPILVLLFGVEIKLAGSLSLVVSLPTMLVGLARYSREQSFKVIHTHRTFVLVMVLGSIGGAFLGARMLDHVPAGALIPVLAAILAISAIKIWRSHRPESSRCHGRTLSLNLRARY